MCRRHPKLTLLRIYRRAAPWPSACLFTFLLFRGLKHQSTSQRLGTLYAASLKLRRVESRLNSSCHRLEIDPVDILMAVL